MVLHYDRDVELVAELNIFFPRFIASDSPVNQSIFVDTAKSSNHPPCYVSRPSHLFNYIKISSFIMLRARDIVVSKIDYYQQKYCCVALGLIPVPRVDVWCLAVYGRTVLRLTTSDNDAWQIISDTHVHLVLTRDRVVRTHDWESNLGQHSSSFAGNNLLCKPLCHELVA